jgi:hypothetical protein
MAQVHIDRWLLVILKMAILSQIQEVTASYKYADSDARPTGPTLDAFSQFFWTTIATAIGNVTTNRLRFLSVTTRDLSPANDLEGAYTIPGTVLGVVNSEPLPLGVSNVISWKTSHVGRSGHGRLYCPSTGEVDMVEGVFSNTYVVLANALGTAINNVSGLLTLHTQQNVASRHDGKLYPVTSWGNDIIPDSQRRRYQGRGR